MPLIEVIEDGEFLYDVIDIIEFVDGLANRPYRDSMHLDLPIDEQMVRLYADTIRPFWIALGDPISYDYFCDVKRLLELMNDGGYWYHIHEDARPKNNSLIVISFTRELTIEEIEIMKEHSIRSIFRYYVSSHEDYDDDEFVDINLKLMIINWPEYAEEAGFVYDAMNIEYQDVMIPTMEDVLDQCNDIEKKPSGILSRDAIESLHGHVILLKSND